MMRTMDGGATWRGWDMSEHATLLVDTYFTDPDNGWVVGGKAALPEPPNPRDPRSHIRAVVLRTHDGGRTWTDKAAPISTEFPLGEWGWKIHFVDDRVGFMSLENFVQAAILKTVDGGETWSRIDVKDPQGNANLEGIGFLDENTGWVGGWGSRDFTKGFSSATRDGGATWQDANHIGLFINRFRFFRDISVGYASGKTVYKYSAEPTPAPLEASAVGELELLADNAPMDTATAASGQHSQGSRPDVRGHLEPIRQARPSPDRRKAAADGDTHPGMGRYRRRRRAGAARRLHRPDHCRRPFRKPNSAPHRLVRRLPERRTCSRADAATASCHRPLMLGQESQKDDGKEWRWHCGMRRSRHRVTTIRRGTDA